MKRQLLASTAFVVGATLGSAALAAPVTFSGVDNNSGGTTPIAHPNSDAARTDFFGNLTGVGTEDFESFAPGTGSLTTNFSGAGSATLSGGSVLNYSSNGRFAISGTQYYQAETTSFSLSFSNPISAFGFYGTDIGDFGGTLTLVLTDVGGNTSSLVVPSSNSDGSVLYFGFYDLSDSYTSIVFNNSNTSDVFGFDDFSIGSAAQVTPSTPEPGSLALLGSGLAAFALSRRRRKA